MESNSRLASAELLTSHVLESLGSTAKLRSYYKDAETFYEEVSAEVDAALPVDTAYDISGCRYSKSFCKH